MTRLLPALVAFACRRPWWTIAAAALLTAIAFVAITRTIAMSSDTATLIAPDVPWRAAERRMDAAFPASGDVILIVIDGATPELAEQAAARLTAALARDRADFRSVTRPDGGDYFAREGLLFGTPADVAQATARMIEAQPFLGPLASDPSLRGIADALGTMLRGIESGDATLGRIAPAMRGIAASLEAQAAGRPAAFSWQALLGGDGGTFAAPRRRLILARPLLDYGALLPGERASGAIRAAARMLALDPAHGVTVRLTGLVPLADEEFASLADKWWLVAGTMLAAMIGTLWLATRSGRMTAAILATTVAGLIVTTALACALIGTLNLISVAFIPLFVGLGVDFGIQLSVRFQAERHEGLGPPDAMRAAVAGLGPALLLAAGAICLGLLAFVPTAYRGIAELGEIASIGMVVALLASVTLLPALATVIGAGRPAREMGSPRLATVEHFLHARRRLVLGLFALAMVGSIALLPFVRFDFDPLDLRNPSGEAMATLAVLRHDPDRNPNTIDVLAPDLPAARALAAQLERVPEVGRVLTLDSFIPSDQARKLATIADARALLDLTLDPIAPLPPPSDGEVTQALARTADALMRAGGVGQAAGAGDARRLAAQFHGLAAASPEARAQAGELLVPPLETMLAQLRASLSAAPVTAADLPADVRRDWIAGDGRARVQVLPRAAFGEGEGLARFTRAVLAIAPDATGVAVSTQGAARTIATAFIEAGVLALIVVSLLLLAVLRDVREVAVTLAPVVLSGFLTLGTCVLIGQPINFANIIAFPLLFGVGVAFHIYFVMAWRAGATDLLQSSLARGVFFSALATGTAFGSLCLSHHPGTASMGKVLMLSLVWTLVCALIFEPALLGPQRPAGRR